jgi:hypothetical protein
MLKVGINENVKLVGAEINDKGSLQISFKDASAVARKKDFLDSIANTKDFSVTNFIIWPVKVEGSEGARTTEQIGRDLGNMRDQLEQILEGYVTSDKANIDPYVGLDTTDAADFQNSLKKQGVVDQIYKSMTTQFVSKVKEIAGTDGINRTFRLKLIRTSKAKHFGTIPKSFVRDNPFFESMSIPATASKVAFTNYEKKNGLDNPDEVTTASADKTSSSTEVSAAASILGRR